MSVIYGNPIITNGGGVKLNIDYGSTPPSDTSKLWVPLSGKPDKVECSPVLNYGSEYLSDYAAIGSGLEFSSSNGSWSSSFQYENYLYWGYSGTKLKRLNVETNVVDEVTMDSVLGHSGSSSSAGHYSFCQNGNNVYCAINSTTISGTGYSGVVVKSDLTTKTAEKICSLPYDSDIQTNVDYMAMQYLNNKLYLFGGLRIGYANVSNKIKIVDLSTNSVLVANAVIPVSGKMFTVCAIGSKIYIMGGAEQYSPKNGVYVYDTINDTCVSVATYPVNAAGMTCIPYAKYIYCFGGSTSNFNDTTPNVQINTIYRFDTTTNQFTQLSIVLPQISIWVLFYKINSMKYKLCAPTNAGKSGGYQVVKTPYVDNFVIESPLTNNNLLLQEDFGVTGLWSALKSKDTDLKVKVINAYLGDSNNIAQLTNAYLYDTASSQWKSLSGESYVADMQNALNILGVN